MVVRRCCPSMSWYGAPGRLRLRVVTIAPMKYSCACNQAPGSSVVGGSCAAPYMQLQGTVFSPALPPVWSLVHRNVKFHFFTVQQLEDAHLPGGRAGGNMALCMDTKLSLGPLGVSSNAAQAVRK
eukprot:363371-Chlamydomonas_euryale.AAC.16